MVWSDFEGWIYNWMKGYCLFTSKFRNNDMKTDSGFNSDLASLVDRFFVTCWHFNIDVIRFEKTNKNCLKIFFLFVYFLVSLLVQMETRKNHEYPNCDSKKRETFKSLIIINFEKRISFVISAIVVDFRNIFSKGGKWWENFHLQFFEKL